MLVLSRKVQEEIIIEVPKNPYLPTYPGDERITITLVKVSTNGATIGIDAPRHFKILRKEVYDREDKKDQF